MPSSRARCATIGEVRAGQDRDVDAVAEQHLDAVAVAHVEDLECFTLRSVVEPPVGQHAVDVEHDQADLCRALLGRHQITFAFIRSRLFSAPTSSRRR